METSSESTRQLANQPLTFAGSLLSRIHLASTNQRTSELSNWLDERQWKSIVCSCAVGNGVRRQLLSAESSILQFVELLVRTDILGWLVLRSLPASVDALSRWYFSNGVNLFFWVPIVELARIWFLRLCCTACTKLAFSRNMHDLLWLATVSRLRSHKSPSFSLTWSFTLVFIDLLKCCSPRWLFYAWERSCTTALYWLRAVPIWGDCYLDTEQRAGLVLCSSYCLVSSTFFANSLIRYLPIRRLNNFPDKIPLRESLSSRVC